MTEKQRQPTSAETPVFGLTREQLRPIVENVAGERVCSFDIAISRTLPAEQWGGACEPAIVEFTFGSRVGSPGVATVFAKRYHNPGPREALHYAWLSRAGAPVPRFYGSILGPEDREVIFLECIDAPNKDAQIYGDEKSCLEFLKSLARFNATRVPEAALSILPRPDWALRLGSTGTWDDHRGYWPTGRVLEEIREHEEAVQCDDRLGLFCRGARAHLQEIAAGAAKLAGPISRMTRGLVHDDFRPAQTGWRRSPREVVIYDLEFVGIGPRFHDAATVLGEPEEDQAFCLSRPEMARGYLEEYARAGGSAPELDTFLHEIRTLHLAHRLSVLGWWPGHVFDEPADPDQSEQEREEDLRRRRDDLCDWLSFLLAGVRQ